MPEAGEGRVVAPLSLVGCTRRAILRAILAGLCALSMLAVPARPQAAESGEAAEPSPELAFGDEITVGLSTVVVRVVDRQGEAVRGLTVADFRVRVDRAEVPVVAAEWVSPGGVAGLDLEGIESLDDILAADPAPQAPPRWVVFFVQTDFHGVRRRGHRNVLEAVQRLPWTLHPGDWAAVVFFDSHLKLWQDFTRERAPIEEALGRSILFGGERVRRPGSERPPSLARHRDRLPAEPGRLRVEVLRDTSSGVRILVRPWYRPPPA